MSKPVNPTRPAGSGAQPWLFAALAILVCLVAITSRTFWIDECYSALFAQQPTLHDWWRELHAIKASEPQMPLYIFWIWACDKFTGGSELALRAVNLFWFVPALVALAAAFAGKRRLQLAVFLAFLFNPFTWYYLNEARGYTMQFSTSLILFVAVVHWLRAEPASAAVERGWAVGFAVALFCLCGSSLLAMLLASAPVLLVLAALPRQRLVALGRHFLPLWLVTLAALFLLGLYYLWTLHAGNRGTDVGTTGWKNLVFIGYELLGFAGLGPGRLEIRDGGNHVFAAYTIALGAYAILLATLAGLALVELRQRFGVKKVGLMALAIGVPMGLVFAASVVTHFRLLGRHCSALLPVVAFLIGLGVAAAWRRGVLGRLLVIVFFGFYLASGLSLRFAARHEKDDYRSAAAAARAELGNGKSVWWNADPHAADYYHVPLTKSGLPEPGHALWVIHSTTASLTGAVPPDCIIASRADVYDEAGALAGFLTQEHYRPSAHFTAFTVWERSRD